MKTKNKLLRFYDKHVLKFYLILLLAGITIILLQLKSANNSFLITINVVTRISIFFINVTIQYVIWNHLFSKIIFEHLHRKKTRLYIGKFRKDVYKTRKYLYFITTVTSIITAIISINIFWESAIKETVLIIFLLFMTIFIPMLQVYFFSSTFYKHTKNKYTTNFKIYSLDYVESKKNENIFEVTQALKPDTPEYNLFDKSTIETFYSLCNNIFFCNVSKLNIYRTFNLMHHEPFLIKQKVRFMSLIYLLEYEKKTDKSWTLEILDYFGYFYKEDYIRNRKKHINDDTLEDSNMTFEDKVKSIIESKA